MIRIVAVSICAMLLVGCAKVKFEECNGLVSNCGDMSEAEYCLFGYKWGGDPFFIGSGQEAEGPGTTGGAISYSFFTENTTLYTHSENEVEAVSFDEIMDCARDEVRSALSEYMAVADITFEELEDNTNADLVFRAAHLSKQSAIGYPNYSHGPCKEIAGNIIFAPTEFVDCHIFYIVALHEIGHALGLGHVRTNNIMAPGRDKFSFDGLQAGDVKGVIAIYGAK